MKNPLIALRRWRLKRQASARCVLGAGSLVYEPERIHPYGGGRESISIGDHTHVRGELLTLPGGRITVGDYCYIGEQTRIWASKSVTIGHRVLIAHLVTVLDNTTHPLAPAARHEHYNAILSGCHPTDVDLASRPVRIEDDAWLACSVIILRGVIVGSGAIVGAGSVVTRDVPPHTLVAGNPARIIRELSDAERGRTRGFEP